jgi:hypothetical protein
LPFEPSELLFEVEAMETKKEPLKVRETDVLSGNNLADQREKLKVGR